LGCNFQFFTAAVELDLFTLLSGSPGLTREELAERLKLENQPTRILLLGCGRSVCSERRVIATSTQQVRNGSFRRRTR
jgi:hypothetical protein